MTAVTLALISTFTLAASTARSSSPVQRDYKSAFRYWHGVGQRQRARADDLQARLTRRVLEVRRMRRHLLTLHARFHAAPTRPPHYSEWLCIHAGEGAWTSNTGNGYYGGLQFSHDTWKRNGGHQYAPEAHLATPLQQMWTAENAWAESGGSFAQWPNTARACGLL